MYITGSESRVHHRCTLTRLVVVVLDQSPSDDDGLLSLSALLEATGAIDDDYDDDSGNDNNWESFLFSTEGEE